MLRGMLVVMMVAAIAGALGLFGTAPVAAQGSATRSFPPATVSPGGQVTVTIDAANYGPSGSVTERLPQGFSYVSSSLDSERVDVDPQQVIFTLQGEASFTYTVTASDKAGLYTFSGTLMDSKGKDHAVVGDSTVTVTAEAATGDPLVDRYDDNNDGTIDKSEVIAAINDYLFGPGANAITKAEVIRLINLYLFGPATAQPPGAPTNLTATANGQTRVDLSWRVPASDGGAAITGYRVEVSTDGSSWSNLAANTDSTTASYSHTGLTAGSTRYYRVSAINSAGIGPASNVATATTDSVPAGPDLIVESPKVSDGSLYAEAPFTLSATVRNQGSGASGGSTTLRYYRSTDSTITSSDEGVGMDEVGSLAPSATSGEAIPLNAPSTVGTYYYGACVDAVSGESNTGNNCSSAVEVTVAKRPDLVVEQPSVNNPNPEPEAPFTLSATVRNQGGGASGSTTLRYYRSTDSTITSSDTDVGMDEVGSLAPSATSGEAIPLNAPSTVGTYYYGACVDAVSRESNTGNNCSSAVEVTVAKRPDLVVEHPSVDDPNPEPGAPFTLSATVRNQGSGVSDSTTLRYYRSTDSTITSSDTDVRMEKPVSMLVPSGGIAILTVLPAERGDGTYYYGACVDAVNGESNTGNNCSDAVEVTVTVQ